MSERPALLVIAGHDPSDGPRGFAGVRADAEAIAAVGRALAADAEALEVVPVVTAWTEQDDAAVRSIGARPSEEWGAEALAAVERLGGRLGGLKIGLLTSRADVVTLARVVARAREDRAELPVVVDPVLASSSGMDFLAAGGREALVEEVLPLGVDWTPNRDEATALVGPAAGAGREALIAQAAAFLERGAGAVLLKGGHGGEDPVLDLLLERAGEPSWFEHPRLPVSLRGTGCRLASAWCAAQALGLGRPEAARLAVRLLAARLAAERERNRT